MKIGTKRLKKRKKQKKVQNRNRIKKIDLKNHAK